MASYKPLVKLDLELFQDDLQASLITKESTWLL